MNGVSRDFYHKKGGHPSETSLNRKFRTMKPEIIRQKQLLLQNVQMDGSVNYLVNGDINIQPCPWEDEKQVTEGRPVYYRANPRATLSDALRDGPRRGENCAAAQAAPSRTRTADSGIQVSSTLWAGVNQKTLRRGSRSGDVLF